MDKKCINCGKVIVNEKFYIEYPYDVYCLNCAKDRSDYNR
jgi:hypothetical protein